MKTSRTFWSVAWRHSWTSGRAERERDVHNVRMIPDAGMDDVDNSNGESGIGTFFIVFSYDAMSGLYSNLST